MKTKHVFSFGVFIVCFLVSSFGTVCASQGPTEQLRPFIDKVINVLDNDTLVARGEMNKADKVMDVVKEGFDFKEMSKRVLGKNWRSLSSSEKKEFVDLFTQLLKYAYVAHIDQYSNQQIVYGKQRVKGNRAEVQTVLVIEDREIQVSYIMLLKEERWRIYDIVVEGVSLVRNYLEQFREILRKEDFESLTRKIEMKIVELQQNSTAS